MKIDLIYTLFKFDDLNPEHLPDYAIEIINNGIENEFLIQLAGLNKPTRAEIEDLVEKGIKPLIESDNKPLNHKLTIAEGIVNKDIDPYKGACLLIHNLYDVHGDKDLEVFQTLMFEYDDYESDLFINRFNNRSGDYKHWLQEVVEEIIAEAKSIIKNENACL